MTTGERIKLCRKAKEMTLEDLGRKINIRPGTINKWENGGIKALGSDKLPGLAKALDTTIEYLLGYVDDPKGRIVSTEESLSQEEKELLRIFRESSLKRKHKLLAFAWELEAKDELDP